MISLIGRGNREERDDKTMWVKEYIDASRGEREGRKIRK